jgi:hypothetical protein
VSTLPLLCLPRNVPSYRAPRRTACLDPAAPPLGIHALARAILPEDRDRHDPKRANATRTPRSRPGRLLQIDVRSAEIVFRSGKRVDCTIFRHLHPERRAVPGRAATHRGPAAGSRGRKKIGRLLPAAPSQEGERVGRPEGRPPETGIRTVGWRRTTARKGAAGAASSDGPRGSEPARISRRRCLLRCRSTGRTRTGAGAAGSRRPPSRACTRYSCR